MGLLYTSEHNMGVVKNNLDFLYNVRTEFYRTSRWPAPYAI